MPFTFLCRILPPVALLLLLAWTPGISMQEDLGRHLLLGRIIVEQGRIPRTNALTHTHADFPFVNHHWLAQVVFYHLHRVVGLNGLIVVKMALIGAALGLALLAVRPTRAGPLYLLAGILAAVMLGFRAHVRPELFTYLAIPFYLWRFEGIRRGADRWRFLVPAAGLFWVNTHIYFIFGIGMAGAFALEQALRKGRTAYVQEGAWLAGLVAVSLLNPNGIRGLLYPLHIFDNYAVDLVENASPLMLWQTALNPMLIALPLFTLLVLAAAGVTLWRHGSAKTDLKRFVETVRPANMVIAAAGLVAAWTMARSAPVLALTGLPVIAAGLGDLTDRQRPAWISRAGTALVMAGALFLGTAVFSGTYSRRFPAPVGPTPVGFDDERRYAALRGLVDNHGLKGPVLTDYNIGSLVEYQLYPQLGYVDNRPEAFPAEFWRTEYAPAFAFANAFEAVCRQRDINAVIVSLTGAGERFFQTMMQNPAWALVYLDDLCAVWVHRHPRNQKIIDRLEFTPPRLDAYVRDVSATLLDLPDAPRWRRQVMADQVLMRLYGLVSIGAADRARPYVRQMAWLYPDYQFVHELLWATAIPHDPAPFSRLLESRARWPLAAKQVADWAAYLVRRGEYREARRVLDRGRCFFPLSPVLVDLRQQVAALTTEVN